MSWGLVTIYTHCSVSRVAPGETSRRTAVWEQRVLIPKRASEARVSDGGQVSCQVWESWGGTGGPKVSPLLVTEGQPAPWLTVIGAPSSAERGKEGGGRRQLQEARVLAGRTRSPVSRGRPPGSQRSEGLRHLAPGGGGWGGGRSRGGSKGQGECLGERWGLGSGWPSLMASNISQEVG